MKDFLAKFGIEIRNRLTYRSLCPYEIDKGTELIIVEGDEEAVRAAAEAGGAISVGQRLLGKAGSRIWYLRFPLFSLVSR